MEHIDVPTSALEPPPIQSFPFAEWSLLIPLVVWLLKTLLQKQSAADAEERELLRALINDLRSTNQELLAQLRNEK